MSFDTTVCHISPKANKILHLIILNAIFVKLKIGSAFTCYKHKLYDKLIRIIGRRSLVENKNNNLDLNLDDLDALKEQVNKETDINKLSSTNQNNGIQANNSAQNENNVINQQKNTLKTNDNNSNNQSLNNSLVNEEEQEVVQSQQQENKQGVNEKQSASYGTAALVLGIFAFLFGILLIVSVFFMGDSDAENVVALVYLIYIGYIIGIFCGSVCGIIAGIMSIVAICKSHRRVISWVGFGVGMLSLVFIIILVGYVLLA